MTARRLTGCSKVSLRWEAVENVARRYCATVRGSGQYTSKQGAPAPAGEWSARCSALVVATTASRAWLRDILTLLSEKCAIARLTIQRSVAGCHG